MSDIGNIGGPLGLQSVQAITNQRSVEASVPDNAEGEFDTVEISFLSEMLGRLRDLPDIRTDKVASIREAIQNGTYDVEGKLDVAVERMLQDLES